MKVRKIPLFNIGRAALISLIIPVLNINPALAAYNLEDYYPLDQGNSWTYEISGGGEKRESVRRIDGNEMVEGIVTVKVFSGADNYECVAVDYEGIKVYKDAEKDDYTIFSPPLILFPNIEVGEKRGDAINLISYYAYGVKEKEVSMGIETTLEAIEDVEVPAGKFSGCLKFSIVSSIKDPERDYYNEEYTAIWLAPGVGKVKEFSIDTEYDPETEEKADFIETYKLTSAVVGQEKIGSR